jgi:hypothetical protein
MVAKGPAFANEILALILNSAAITNIAQNGASPATNTTIALHTAAPTGDVQTLNEVTVGAYNSYVRQNVSRSGTGGWATPSGGQSFLAVAVTFPAMVSGTGASITHWSIGHASVANKLMYQGGISPSPLVVSAGVTPQLTVGSNISES